MPCISRENPKEKDHQKQVEALQSKMEESELKATATSVSKPTTNDLKSVLRREFKINGQIGEPGQKDKLTFASSKGYSETEVIDGVIRAIIPSMQLRSYLETVSNLTLPKLRAILRSPLVSIYGNPSSKPPARIERWAHRL
jgi:hypothetical protein